MQSDKCVTGKTVSLPLCCTYLLLDISDGAAQQLDKEGNSAGLDDKLGLGRGARSDVGQSPSSLKLRWDKENE